MQPGSAGSGDGSRQRRDEGERPRDLPTPLVAGGGSAPDVRGDAIAGTGDFVGEGEDAFDVDSRFLRGVLGGEAGIGLFEARDELVDGQRISFRPKLRVFDLYALRDGHWIQVGSDTAPHPETQEATRRLYWPVDPATRQQILADREAVWRAFFTGEAAELERLVPPEAIVIGADREAWSRRDDVLAASRAFAEAGGKLHELEFPETEIQRFGDVAVVYTSYRYTIEIEGRVDTAAGRGTEIFVLRDGRWVNPGWHLDNGVSDAS